MTIKDQIIDWFNDNAPTIIDIIQEVDSRQNSTSDTDVLFFLEIEAQKFIEIKNQIVDNISRDLGIHSDVFSENVTDEELTECIDNVLYEFECDHSDMDEGHCLDCGEDLTEFEGMRAYDLAKSRKYDD